MAGAVAGVDVVDSVHASPMLDAALANFRMATALVDAEGPSQAQGHSAG